VRARPFAPVWFEPSGTLSASLDSLIFSPHKPLSFSFSFGLPRKQPITDAGHVGQHATAPSTQGQIAALLGEGRGRCGRCTCCRPVIWQIESVAGLITGRHRTTLSACTKSSDPRSSGFEQGKQGARQATAGCHGWSRTQGYTGQCVGCWLDDGALGRGQADSWQKSQICPRKCGKAKEPLRRPRWPRKKKLCGLAALLQPTHPALPNGLSCQAASQGPDPLPREGDSGGMGYRGEGAPVDRRFSGRSKLLLTGRWSDFWRSRVKQISSFDSPSPFLRCAKPRTSSSAQGPPAPAEQPRATQDHRRTISHQVSPAAPSSLSGRSAIGGSRQLRLVL